MLVAVILAQAVPPPITITQAPPPIQTYPKIPPPAPPAVRISRQVPATPPADTSQTFPFETVGAWQVRVDMTLKAGCYAFAQFEDGSVIRVFNDPGNKLVYFGLGNWRWRSLSASEKYTLKVTFDREEPWEGEASVLDFGSANMLFLEVNADFLTELAMANVLNASYGSKRIATLSLADSDGALGALVRCERSVNERIGDPFAN